MKTFEELLNDHDPLIIYPWITDMTFVRLVGEGFLFPEGFFFYDEGWNTPLSGTGMDHFVDGEITSHNGSDPVLGIWTPHWLITRSKEPPVLIAILEEGHFPTKSQGTVRWDLMMRAALLNQKQAIELQDAEYGSRKAALKWAEVRVNEFRQSMKTKER